eukprot:765343-Hanusia_phi.AAC.2
MDTGIFRIFLEYMPMGSVAALLRMMGPLDEDVVRTFTQQLLCGVAFMHSNGVVHRDIKPANLLLGINGVLKVSDFGEAKWLPNVVKDAEHAMLQSMHGTTRYMAPEVIRRQYTIAADVWSIGCTVLEMLTGVMPYSSLSNDMAVARCVLRNEEPPLEEGKGGGGGMLRGGGQGRTGRASQMADADCSGASREIRIRDRQQLSC